MVETQRQSSQTGVIQEHKYLRDIRTLYNGPSREKSAGSSGFKRVSEVLSQKGKQFVFSTESGQSYKVSKAGEAGDILRLSSVNSSGKEASFELDLKSGVWTQNRAAVTLAPQDRLKLLQTLETGLKSIQSPQQPVPANTRPEDLSEVQRVLAFQRRIDEKAGFNPNRDFEKTLFTDGTDAVITLEKETSRYALSRKYKEDGVEKTEWSFYSKSNLSELQELYKLLQSYEKPKSDA